LELSGSEVAGIGARAALDRKANDVVVLDLRGLSSVTDFFVICSGNSDTHVAGIADIIDYTELSTPLSTHFFTGHPGGVIYGIPATSDRYRQDWLKIRSPLKNLFLTGSDIASHGISGAMFGGVLTSAVIMGLPLSLWRIFNAANRFGRKLSDGMSSTIEQKNRYTKPDKSGISKKN